MSRFKEKPESVKRSSTERAKAALNSSGYKEK